MHRQYSRTFVTLTQECGDYTQEGRHALGSCIIESKKNEGKIIANVQSLKKQFIYKLCLVAPSEHVTICVKAATFNPDGNNKYVARCEFNANDVFGTGLPIEDFKVITVICVKKEDNIVLLSGYIKEEIPWHHKISYFEKNDNLRVYQDLKDVDKIIEVVKNDSEKIADNTINSFSTYPGVQENRNTQNDDFEKVSIDLKDESETEEVEKTKSSKTYDANSSHSNRIDKIEKDILLNEKENKTFENFSFYKSDRKEETGEDIDLKTAGTEQMNFHETFKAMAQKFNEEIEQLSEIIVKSEEELDAKDLVTQEKYTVTQTELVDIENQEIKKILDGNPKISPFKNPSQQNAWVTITLDELSVLPFDCIRYRRHPIFISRYYKYKHFIFGKAGQHNEKEYILGIPDIYDSAIESELSDLGFVEFQPCSDENLKDGVYGYWFMAV